MTLRRKTLLFIGGTMVALLAAVHSYRVSTVTDAFAQLERHAVEKDVARILSAIDGELGNLSSTAEDWATWDATYDFASSGHQDYVLNNLGEETLKGLDLDFMVFLDEGGSLLHAQNANMDHWLTRDAPDQLLAAFLGSGERAAYTSTSSGDESPSGLTVVGDVGLLVASHPILRSDRSGPPRGFVLAGSYLDASRIARLSTLTHVPFRIVRADAAELPESLDALTSASTPDPQARVQPLDSETVAGYAFLRDIGGRSALAVVAERPRDIFATGLRITNYLSAYVIVLGLVATGLIMWVLSRQVLTPVAELSRRVSQIGSSYDSTQRVWISRRDEVGKLATAINEMLGALEVGERDLRAAHHDLEARVEQRTAELARTVYALETENEDRRSAEEALRESEQRYRALVQSMADAVFTLDRRGRFTFVNPRAETLTRYSAEELLSRSYEDILTADSAAVIRRRLIGAGTPRNENIEVELINGRGELVPVELSLSALKGPQGGFAGIQGIARDITERKRFEAELLHVATHDYLTGLFNRRRFEQELEREIAESQRHDRRGAIIWLDLDHFKEINDSLGHRAGDEVLIAVSETLRARVRGDNILARLGGDEFAILMPAADSRDAQAATRRLLDEMREQTYMVGSHLVRVSASVGIVLYPAHGSTVEELLSRADIAMYHAKERGRNRFSVYVATDEWHMEVKVRRSWAERIEQALREKAFVLHAQPIVNLETGRITRYELLSRMVGDDGELIPPGAFLPAAERLGLVNEIDELMLAEALKLISAAASVGKTLKLDINLSARALSDTEFLRTIEREVERSRIDPALLGIEITETAIIGDLARAQEFVRTLKHLGCRFSLDDFGSGFSSFYHLKHLPIDILKIDGSFIRELADSDADQHLVRAMVELSKGLGMRTTAEYVEDEAALDLLRLYGVDFAQGYHLGKPGPVSDVLKDRLGPANGALGTKIEDPPRHQPDGGDRPCQGDPSRMGERRQG